jgi:hypothetical protein
VQLTVFADGYHQEKKVVGKGKENGIEVVDIALQSTTEVLTAEISGILKDASTGAAVKGLIFIPSLELQIEADKDGHFHATLKPGRYQLLISSPRSITQKKEIQVHGGDSVILNIDLLPRSK